MKVNVHAGHNPDGKVASGAAGFIKESTQARKVVDKIIEKLQAAGHTVYNCTCNTGSSQSDVLHKIVEKCNAHDVDLDVSIHFNSGASDRKGNGKTTGTEVLIQSESSKAKEAAERICKSIEKLGFTNRGVKVRKDLYILNHTKAPALLVECCFVDDKDDAELYRAEKMAQAIVTGIMGGTEDEVVDYNVKVTAKGGLNCRIGPGIKNKVVCSFEKGTVLTITKERDGWGKCSKGWIKLEYTKKI